MCTIEGTGRWYKVSRFLCAFETGQWCCTWLIFFCPLDAQMVSTVAKQKRIGAKLVVFCVYALLCVCMMQGKCALWWPLSVQLIRSELLLLNAIQQLIPSLIIYALSSSCYTYVREIVSICARYVQFFSLGSAHARTQKRCLCCCTLLIANNVANWCKSSWPGG